MKQTELEAEYNSLRDTNDPIYLLTNHIIAQRLSFCPSCGIETCPIRRVEADGNALLVCPIVSAAFCSLDERVKVLKSEKEQIPWIGVDLDGTLAHWKTWEGPEDIGEPIKDMVYLVKKFLEKGICVKILSARVATNNPCRAIAEKAIKRWTKKHIGVVLEVTAEKDRFLVSCYDDLTHQVIHNQGRLVETLLDLATKDLRTVTHQLMAYQLKFGPRTLPQ